MTDPFAELQKFARLKWNTTPGDVINAVRAGTLEDKEARAFVRKAEEVLPPDHPELNDDDPDDVLGWCMVDGKAVAEVE